VILRNIFVPETDFGRGIPKRGSLNSAERLEGTKRREKGIIYFGRR